MKCMNTHKLGFDFDHKEFNKTEYISGSLTIKKANKDCFRAALHSLGIFCKKEFTSKEL